ncbi:sialidase family protein [Cohnella silvisoli]|uniref:Sialidase family protein n=1 Tax=Cohnella silvisoli TaxID=2873699 RepID=A0ABV1L363_9BACL|nr:sialidase family protein [Cohnella silvisoli]MCD9025802.1 glycoside hydrolase [Cohnella silvisoli]
MNGTDYESKDLALQPVRPDTAPGPAYADNTRQWQGIPGIERSRNGRLWVTFYSGGTDEGPDNYVVLVNSDDDGKTWSKPLLIIDPPGQVRAYDPCLWCDPQDRLWLFWAQSYGWFDGRCGVWAAVCTTPESTIPAWSEPRRIANGIMMNKPTVLTTGEWLLPAAIWDCQSSDLNVIAEERFSNVICSTDQGETFSILGNANIPNRCFDEHMIVERNNGSLWMLVRLYDGIGESVSLDRGKTWSAGSKTNIEGPNSRFFIRRLRSGRLLLINHNGYIGRNNLTAMLSEDEGATWQGYLLLDDRSNVSYPDGVQAEDGTIYIVYDRERYIEREIVMAVFTEEDVLLGQCVSNKARLQVIVNKAGS